LLAVIGILFSVGVLLRLEHDVQVQRSVSRSAPPAATVKSINPQPSTVVLPERTRKTTRRPRNLTEADVAVVAAQAPWWVWPLLNVAKGLGVLVYLIQIPVTYAAVRLEYEQRWYIVTDRSLRIREGLWRIQELTMSFANLQQVSVSQGPIERLFRIANLEVQSAGGGSGSIHRTDREEASLHKGVFHGVDNAHEIRDLVLERLRQFRATGLGDPDETADHGHGTTTTGPTTEIPRDETLLAARDLLMEAQALRCAIRSA
jgi:membrane protein YdbS with pleckstrin-like domain